MSKYVENNPVTKLVINGKDFTNLYTVATWSGTISEAARELTFNLVDSGIDPYLPSYNVQIEDMVQFYAYGKEIFRGYIIDFRRSLNSNEVEYTCFDGAFYLLQSHVTRTYKCTTPDKTTLDVCGEVNVPVAKTFEGSPYDRIHDNDTVYDVIMTGYTLQAAKDGKEYMLRMGNGALSVVLKGEFVCPDMLTANETLTQADYTESILGGVNRVKTYDESRQEIKTLELEDNDISGVLQAVVQDDDGDAETKARSLLKGIQRTASVGGLGRLDCITGNACVIQEPFTTLQGLFYIDGDTHTFKNKTHTMTLDLEFENIMDEVLAGKEKEETDEVLAGEEKEEQSATMSGGGRIPEDGPATEIWNILRGLGYSQAAAAAMIANAEYESGLDPNRPQMGGPGMGLFQWSRGERWDTLVSWANANGYDPLTIEAQIRFADHEMKTINWLMSGVGGYEAFKNASGVSEAHRMFYHGFERPAYNPANYALREQAANDYFDIYTIIEESMNHTVSDTVSDGTWTFPVPGYSYMSSDYGANNPYRPDHLGVDFAAAGGTPILAASGGTVGYAGWADGYGNLVVIDHGGGIATAYAHIMPNGIHVSVGQGVSTGQKIASVGTTGPSTGNHLHFEVRTGYNGGAYGGWNTNPRNYITY